MANTNDLKSVIEPALFAGFLRVHNAQPFEVSGTVQAHLFGMQLDGFGISADRQTLHICEITASGFQGNRGDFHIGAVRKFADAFARFSIIHHLETRKGLLDAVSKELNANLRELKCHFVVPRGCRFIYALGYRKRLLELGIMDLVEIELSDSDNLLLNRVIDSARGEIARGSMPVSASGTI